MRADGGRFDRQPAGVDDQDILDLLELRRLTRELLDSPHCDVSAEEAADLLRAK
jgi:hypothetical protein